MQKCGWVNAYRYNADKVGKYTAEQDFAQFRDLDEETIGEHESELKWDYNEQTTHIKLY